jgi:hypothetical protein
VTGVQTCALPISAEIVSGRGGGFVGATSGGVSGGCRGGVVAALLLVAARCNDEREGDDAGGYEAPRLDVHVVFSCGRGFDENAR